MDHEFSTAPLQPGITGWDWFSLQLSGPDRDHDLLAASTGRNLESGLQRHIRAAPRGKRGTSRVSDVRIEPLSYWTSPHSGARYPVEWQAAVVPLGLVELTVTANLDDQEMRTPSNSTHVVYWEGSVQAKGTRNVKRRSTASVTWS